MSLTTIALYGAGGFGREVAWLIEECNRSQNRYDFLGFIDDRAGNIHTANGNAVFSLAHVAESFPDAKVAIAVGDPKLRRQLANRVLEAGLQLETLIHPNVVRSS